MDQPVLVIGGTRGTGLHVVSVLRQRGARVRVLARKPADARRHLSGDVEIVEGDLTIPETLLSGVHNVNHIIFTAGVRSGRFARQSVVRATEYEGVRSTLSAALTQGFTGRFVYMTTIGVTRPSRFGTALNIWKGNTLVWRRRAEDAIRSSGVDYTVVRAAFLLNRPAGIHEICVSQEDRPLNFREAVGRADVAEALVAVVFDERAARATLSVSWCEKPRQSTWPELLADLRPDSIANSTLNGLAG